jgi:hypothetical protein
MTKYRVNTDVQLWKIITLCTTCALIVMAAQTLEAQRRREVKVPKEIVVQFMKDDEFKDTLERKHEYTFDGMAKRLVAESVDLNRDGKPELIVHGINDICGPYWCANRIYRKTKAGYQLLLDGGDIQDFELQKTFTNGYRDVMAASHGSAFDSGLELYKYDGKRYGLKACFERHYNNRENSRGHLHVSKRPKITRVKCETDQ